MNNYELLCVINTEWAEGDLTKAERMMTAELEKVDGRVLKIEKMGSRRLAYPIKGQKEGIYLVFYFTAPASAVSALRANLKLNPGLLRTLIIKTRQPLPLELEPPPASTEGKKIETEEKPEEVGEAAKEAAVETEQKKEEGINDEIRMTNDEGMTKSSFRSGGSAGSDGELRMNKKKSAR